MQPRRVQLIAIDLDGTLLDSRGKLPERNRDALHRAHQAGLKVVLCTGRSYVETRPVIDDIGLDLDATVTVGGALITDVQSGATIEAAGIEPPLARRVGEWFRERSYAILWLHDRNAAGFDGFAIDGRRRHKAIDVWLARSGCEMRSIAELPQIEHAPLRITILDGEPELESLAVAMRSAFGESVSHNLIHVPAYDFSVIETFGGSVNKWYGIVRLCARWGIDPRATAAVGDDVNDVPMLQSAGRGFAVANARPAALAAAPLRTARNDDCGVADVIDEILADVPRRD